MLYKIFISPKDDMVCEKAEVRIERKGAATQLFRVCIGIDFSQTFLLLV